MSIAEILGEENSLSKKGLFSDPKTSAADKREMANISRSANEFLRGTDVSLTRESEPLANWHQRTSFCPRRGCTVA